MIKILVVLFINILFLQVISSEWIASVQYANNVNCTGDQYWYSLFPVNICYYGTKNIVDFTTQTLTVVSYSEDDCKNSDFNETYTLGQCSVLNSLYEYVGEDYEFPPNAMIEGKWKVDSCSDTDPIPVTNLSNLYEATIYFTGQCLPITPNITTYRVCNATVFTSYHYATTYKPPFPWHHSGSGTASASSSTGGKSHSTSGSGSGSGNNSGTQLRSDSDSNSNGNSGSGVSGSGCSGSGSGTGSGHSDTGCTANGSSASASASGTFSGESTGTAVTSGAFSGSGSSHTISTSTSGSASDSSNEPHYCPGYFAYEQQRYIRKPICFQGFYFGYFCN